MAYYVYSGQISSGIELYYDQMYISSGGVANSTTVNDGGSMYISSGGVANSTTVNNLGIMYISGGTANSVTVNSSGLLYVDSGGYVENLTLAIGRAGYMVKVYSGCSAVNVFVYEGGDFELHGGYAKNVILSRTWAYGDLSDLFIMSGGRAENIMVGYCGNLDIRSGTANNVTVNSYGRILISSNCMANSTTVNYGGSMFISNGGRVTGTLSIADGAIVYAYAGSLVDFDISTVAPGAAARVNNLALVSGTPNFTVTVSCAWADMAISNNVNSNVFLILILII